MLVRTMKSDGWMWAVCGLSGLRAGPPEEALSLDDLQSSDDVDRDEPSRRK